MSGRRWPLFVVHWPHMVVDVVDIRPLGDHKYYGFIGYPPAPVSSRRHRKGTEGHQKKWARQSDTRLPTSQAEVTVKGKIPRGRRTRSNVVLQGRSRVTRGPSP